MLDTPIPIINNVCIELTRVRLKKGLWYSAKRYMFLADIVSIEVDRYGADNEKCTRLDLRDDTYIKVKEPYRKIKETHEAWFRYAQEQEEKQGGE